MCGICGKLNFDPTRPIDTVLLERMGAAIAHRGPDGAGTYTHGPIGLSHRRLSIIDLSTGDQPMCGEDGTVWVVFNGEIYNYRDLRSDLQRRGHHFKSSSDTEVIVHLYEEFGAGAVAKLQGMFAFALWDQRNELLLLARDRTGIKPLYYTRIKDAIVFASEIKALLCDPDVPRRVNVSSFDRFLTYYYAPGANTPFIGIQKVPPAHYLTVRRGAVRMHEYWDLPCPTARTQLSFAQAAHELQDILRATVRDHLISDVPVGVLLSGGVDSSGVLSYASEASDAPLHSFTVGFGGQGFQDERPYARLVAERCGTTHHEITIRASEFRDALPLYVWHMEEPVCEPPAIALLHVARLAREAGVKVLLSGEGGDEAFGGYQTYRNLLLLERLKRALGPAKPMGRAALRLAAALGLRRASAYSGLISPTIAQYYLSRTATPATLFNLRKDRLFRPEILEALRSDDSREPTRTLFERVGGRPLLDQMLYIDTKTWLPDDLLIKADRMTMATSVELRVPLLDARVLEFAATLPPNFKVQGLSGKRILKAAFAGAVPREILTRRKAGFPVPYDRWLRLDLEDFVRGTVLSSASCLREYFNASAVESIIEDFYRTGAGAKEVFCLLILELWLQRFAGPATTADLLARQLNHVHCAPGLHLGSVTAT